jgi:hypothetical protein
MSTSSELWIVCDPQRRYKIQQKICSATGLWRIKPLADFLTLFLGHDIGFASKSASEILPIIIFSWFNDVIDFAPG